MPNEDLDVSIQVKEANNSIKKSGKNMAKIETSAKKAGANVEKLDKNAKKVGASTATAKKNMTGFTQQTKSGMMAAKGVMTAIAGSAIVMKGLNIAAKTYEQIVARTTQGLKDNLATYQATLSLRAMEKGGVVEKGAMEAAKAMVKASEARGYKISEEEALSAMALVAPKAMVTGIPLERMARIIPEIGAMATAGGRDMSLSKAVQRFLLPMMETGDPAALGRLGFPGIDKDKLREMKTVSERIDATFGALEKFITSAKPSAKLMEMAMGEGEDATRAMAIIMQRQAGISLAEFQEEKPETKERLQRQLAADLIKWQATQAGFDVTESAWENIGSELGRQLTSVDSDRMEKQWAFWKRRYEAVKPSEGLFDRFGFTKAPMEPGVFGSGRDEYGIKSMIMSVIEEIEAGKKTLREYVATSRNAQSVPSPATSSSTGIAPGAFTKPFVSINITEAAK